jgi:hypothetical protein
MGFKIGTSYVGCPTCADDIMLCAKSEQEAQTQLDILMVYFPFLYNSCINSQVDPVIS